MQTREEIGSSRSLYPHIETLLRRATLGLVFRALLITLSAWLLSSCVSLTAEVGEVDRDLSGQFDGRWSGTLAEGKPSRFTKGQWTLTCSSGSNRFVFDIANGVVTYPYADGSESPSTFISGKGTFKLEIPISDREIVSRESGSAGKTRRKLVFSGNLGRKNPKVVYLVSQEFYGWGGCSWPVDVQKLGS